MGKGNIKDTICAVSTPAGVGGIAVIRLSGSEAKRMAESCLKTPSDKSVILKNRNAKFVVFYDGDAMLDELVATYFAAPNSYTGEDVVEFSCHGSTYIQQRILQILIGFGARLAEAGEFTLRAFLNGRLDLSQAEAVADLIDSQSQMAHHLAVSQMRGGYAKELEQLRQELIDTTALLELELDFSEEDLEFANRERLGDMVEELYSKVKRLSDSFQTGNAIKNGIPVAIVGRPNAGKSTLLNALLNEDRAIVSDTPGTTRDTIEDSFFVDGIEFRIIDTAGLRDSDDPLEKMGMERTYKSLEKSSIILLLHDSQVPFEEFKDDIGAMANHCPIDKTMLLVHTKCDLCKPDIDRGLMTAAKNGKGVEEIKRFLVKTVREKILKNTDVLLTNARHYEAMNKVLAALYEVRKGMDAGLTPDLLVIDMRDALYHLGTITGKVSSDDVLSSVFSRFCVGK
ncbi:MAG: tRNA uridine-5-carboxymethylaminomethyl(34) synthesis GTPase MnmE [Bacteroidales bacterium]|nr:tRNA uridine-5-carboxymethylaminomethyl(34) synthesis GTPase MnmE [Bacteroidales bacterium]